ncbi:unnamed protein product, partial [Adineta ricciae]
MGMKKDFLYSKEKTQRRKQRLDQNRVKTTKHSSSTSQHVSISETVLKTSNRIDNSLIEMNNNDESVHFQPNILMKTLSIAEHVTIENVRSLFLSMFRNDTITRCMRIDVSNRACALTSWSYFLHEIFLSFINFFRQTDEFKCLNGDDRFLLIKFNIFPLFILSKCINYRPSNDCCARQNCKEVEKQRRFFTLCGAENNFRDEFADLIYSLVNVTEQDPVLLSFISIIFIYSHGSLFNDYEPLLKDSIAVYRAQTHYTELLWNYLLIKFGELQA